MSAAPSLTHKLETAAHSLNDAKCSHLGTVVAYTEAKRALELAQARLLLDGVTGSNKEQREAVMRLQLTAHFIKNAVSSRHARTSPAHPRASPF